MALQKGELTALFRKRRSALLPGISIPVELHYTHPATGSELFFAKIEKKPHPNAQQPYVVGWRRPDEKTTWFYRNFATRQESLAFFVQQKISGPPSHLHFKRDLQVNRVYRWENSFSLKSPTLTEPQMKHVVGRLSKIFNMKAPEVTYKPREKNTYAEAVLDENRIIMYRPNLALLLHEFAHLVNDQVNKDKWAWHGPGFVRTYLSILSLFPDVAQDMDLEKTAARRGVKIAKAGDIRASRHLEQWVAGQEDGKALEKLIPKAA